VQDHRIHRDQLLTLQAIDEEARRLGEIELDELRLDRIEAIDCAAIVIFVVTDEQLLRHSFDP
jgi:hypothetical protein